MCLLQNQREEEQLCRFQKSLVTTTLKINTQQPNRPGGEFSEVNIQSGNKKFVSL
jgi:hypothetical protein